MLYEKIIHDAGSTFSHKVYPHFTMPWHFHPEYELMIIKSGGGRRFAGDHIDDYHPGDLVLYGSNLPHFHMCYGLLANDPDAISACEVIQFSGDIFPEKASQIEELGIVWNLLEKSQFGIKFINPPSVDRITSMMRRLDKQTGVKRIATLMRLLEILGSKFEYSLMNNTHYAGNQFDTDLQSPINRIYRYLTDNFREELTLTQIAGHVGFNPSALCRYFKKATQKSIFDCLMNIRINFACKLLCNSTLSVSQIAFESGYSNISNFNRQFKFITGYSPTQYRNLYWQRNINIV